MVSHTATGEWQSFEAKMRRRRAERMLVRAQAAIDAGRLDEARQCLDEARGLARDLRGIPLLEARIAAPPPRVVSPGFGSRMMWSVAVLALVAAFSVGWWSFSDQAPWVWDETAAAVQRPDTRSVAAESTSPPPAAPAPTASNPTVAGDLVGPSEAEAEPASMTRATTTAPTATPATSEPGRENDAPTRVQLPISSSEMLPIASNVPAPTPQPDPPAAKDDPVPAPGVPAPAPPPPVTPLALAATVPPASIVVAAPTVELSQEPLVRSVLHRYASAYSALDVDAAAQVWPTVNRAALSRAFEGLASQRLALQDCRVDIAETTARARCSGTATWSPKVGAGTHTEARAWTFDLARGGAGWQIVNARAQNR